MTSPVVPKAASGIFAGCLAVGKADGQGRIVYKTGAAGAALFIAGMTEPAPAGAVYDTTNLSTSLYVSW